MFWTILHLSLHVLIPGAAARLFFAQRWKAAWLIMVLTMLVDLDHLLADPVYDPTRCSIGFHPLHSWAAIGVYGLMAMWAPVRIAAVGLLLHMGIDGLDCLRM